MSTIITREVGPFAKGSPLTNAELDANFININDGKLEATAYSAADVLAKLLTVHGAGSGLDADLLDGQEGAYYLDIANLIGTPLYFDFDIQPEGTVTPARGRMWYNDEDDTINIGHADGTVQQVGQEFFLPPIINTSGVEIPNGSYVMVTGVQGDKFAVAKAVTDGSVEAHYMVGVATSTIPINGDTGKIVTVGMVRDFDTSAWPIGTILFPDPTTPGGFVNTKPTAPALRGAIAIVLKQAVQGWLYVRNVICHKLGEHDSDVSFGTLADNDLVQYDLAAQAWKNVTLYDAGIAPLVPGSPTGFVFPDQISSEYDSITRTVTLTGDLTAFFHGKPTGLTSPWTSPPHPNELNKAFFLYTQDGENWIWTEQPWKFEDWQAAFIYYGTTDKFGLNEYHGLMQWQVHDELHHMIGTYKSSGGTITGFVANSTTIQDRRPDVVETVIKDEDIKTTLPALINPGENYKQLNLTSTGIATFTNNQTDIVPVSGSRPYYNQFTGGNWVQTLLPSGNYMSVWLVAIPVTTDAQSQGYRYVWFQGQTATNLAGQQALTPPDISWGNFTALATEFVVLGKVILGYGGGNWSIDSYETFSGGRASSVGAPSGNFLSSVLTDSTLTGNGTTISALSVDLEGTVAQELVAVPRKVHFVYGGSPDAGVTPDATTQASIDALLAINIPIENIRWIYTA